MEAGHGEVLNLGGQEPVALIALAKMLVEIAGRGGSYRLVPFPADRKKIDIGDFYADTTKIRAALGWHPQVPLRDGLARTVDYYREHAEHYLSAWCPAHDGRPFPRPQGP